MNTSEDNNNIYLEGYTILQSHKKTGLIPRNAHEACFC